jgi:hypothetical protein
MYDTILSNPRTFFIEFSRFLPRDGEGYLLSPVAPEKNLHEMSGIAAVFEGIKKKIR